MPETITSVAQPLVSVIMPVYNGRAYLREAIESILNQTYANFEFLILNDGSTDNSLAIIQSFEDKRILCFDDKENRGAYPRLNQGIQAAKGQYIAIMDADDISLPKRLERQVAYLEKQPEVALLGTQVKLLIEPQKSLLPPKRQAIQHDHIIAYQLFYCPFVHPSVMIRASVAKQNPYPTASKITQDFHLWTQLLPKYEAANLNETLLHYRRHQTNQSSNHTTTLANLKNIFSVQFTRLNIPFTAADMETHLLISDSNPALLSLQQFKNIKQWLHKLDRFNQQHQRYDNRYFSKLLKMVYLECWLWKVKHPFDYFNFSESLLFKSTTSWLDKWRLLRSFFYRLRQK